MAELILFHDLKPMTNQIKSLKSKRFIKKRTEMKMKKFKSQVLSNPLNSF